MERNADEPSLHVCLRNPCGVWSSAGQGGQKARGSIHIATWFASPNETVIRSRFVCKEVLRGFDDNLKVRDWDWTIFGVAAWQTADGIPQTSRSLVQHVFVPSCLLNVLLQDLALLLKVGRVRRWKDWTERKVEKRYTFFFFLGMTSRCYVSIFRNELQDVAWTCCNQSHMTSELQTQEKLIWRSICNGGEVISVLPFLCPGLSLRQGWAKWELEEFADASCWKLLDGNVDAQWLYKLNHSQ